VRFATWRHWKLWKVNLPMSVPQKDTGGRLSLRFVGAMTLTLDP
jgi:hypothetical protein